MRNSNTLTHTHIQSCNMFRLCRRCFHRVIVAFEIMISCLICLINKIRMLLVCSSLALLLSLFSNFSAINSRSNDNISRFYNPFMKIYSFSVLCAQFNWFKMKNRFQMDGWNWSEREEVNHYFFRPINSIYLVFNKNQSFRMPQF